MLRIRKLFREELGATAVEYAVVIGLIAVVVVASVSNMTAATADSFDRSGDELQGVLGP